MGRCLMMDISCLEMGVRLRKGGKDNPFFIGRQKQEGRKKEDTTGPTHTIEK